jgi:hypothetical protein
VESEKVLLGHVPTREAKCSTEIVENPVEKSAQTYLSGDKNEQFSGLHHRSAIVNRINTGLENRRIIL